MALPVAVQVYSVRDDAKADLRGTLEKIKKMELLMKMVE